MAMPMSMVSACDVTECSYNADGKCHTLAITVGNGKCPMCDTFVQMQQKGGAQDILGGVGACRATTCKFNQALECTAGSVHVGWHAGHADCKTFAS